jgi:hypothetical protein
MTTDDLLQQGVAALKEGRRADARRVLAQVVQQDRQNEAAWLWLSGAVNTDAERRICLENVLAINPNNGIAKRGLERLGIKQKTAPFTIILPPPRAEEVAALDIRALVQPEAPDTPDLPDEAEGEAEEQPEEQEEASTLPSQRPRRRLPGLVVAIGTGVFVFICSSIVVAWWAITSGWLPLGARPATPTAVEIEHAPSVTDTGSMPLSSPTSPPTWTRPPTQTPETPPPTRTPRPTETPHLTWTPTLTPTATITSALAATSTPAITLPPTWTPHPTSTPAPGLTPPPTWTPQAVNTSPPTWTPHPTSTPAPGITLPPTWTPYPTSTPAPGITLPPTWTPAYPIGSPTILPTTTLTGALTIATPAG